MPGPHIDKIVNEATERMTYRGLQGDALAKATPEERELDKTKYGVEVGSQVFKEIESSGLTPQERQEVYQKLVKAGVQDELNNTLDPATLLRGNNATTRFMTDYMNTYAKGYMEAVYEDTLKVAIQAKSQLPESLVGKKLTNPYGHIDDVSQEDIGKLYKSYGEITKESIQSSERNLSKLSPEAREFLKVALEPTVGNKEGMNTVVAGTLLLRGASTRVYNAGTALRSNEETQDLGNLMMGANIGLQSYANSVNRPFDKPLGTDKPQNVVANQLRTQDSMLQTESAYEAISKGSESIDKFVSSLGVEVDDLDVDLTQEVGKLKETVERLEQERALKAKELELKGQLKKQEQELQKKEQELQAKLKPFNDQIQALGDKKAQLQTNPSIGDKIKCFFKHGLKGVDGEIEKLDKKIEATKVAKNDVETGVTMEQRQQDLDRMKHNQASLGVVLQQAEGVVVKARLDESGLTTERSVSDKQLKEALSEGTSVKELQKELGAQIKAQEKVMSVREKLGPKAPEKAQGQSKGLGV